jgi:hypothetical protein
LMEIKFADFHIRDFTVEMGTSNNRELRVRHGRVTREKTATVLAGVGNVIERVLWIVKPGSNTRTGVSIRDGYHKVLNCGCFQMDGAGQPTASTPHGNGTVDLFASRAASGSIPTLYWGDWPTKATLPSGPAYRWVSTGKAMIGGCHLKPTIRDSFSEGDNTVRPDSCRVAPANPSRADRNWQIGPWDDDNANPTDFTTPVPGANYNNVATRQLSTNVGPRAYARLFVGDEVIP